MTKQEIRDEAKKRYSSNEELDAFCRSAYCLGAEMVNEKQPYTAEDMKKAIKLLQQLRKIYLFHVDADGKPQADIFQILNIWPKVNELLKLWEEQRNEN
jgi:CRISPR/Cas system-associated protein Cas10 (large subunit of type III CRISPR-Cas system)